MNSPIHTRLNGRASHPSRRQVGLVLWWLAITMLATVANAQVGDFRYKSKAGTITITKYIGTNTVVNIPAEIDGLPVTTIGSLAFDGQTTLTSITIPDSVTRIKEKAFYRCSSLTSLAIPQGVTSIEDHAFSACRSLTQITLPDYATHMGVSVFFACDSLTNIALPNGITSIEDWSFLDCSRLASITIPDSVTNIGSLAFWGCCSLFSLIIPEGVARVQDYAFEGCSSLESLYFKGDAHILGTSVFARANAATVYYMPSTRGWTNAWGGRPAVLWNPLAQPNDGNFGPKSQGFGFTVTGSSNLVIVVEAATNLANPVWVPVSTLTLTNGFSFYNDTLWTNYPSRFYRFRAP